MYQVQLKIHELIFCYDRDQFSLERHAMDPKRICILYESTLYRVIQKGPFLQLALLETQSTRNRLEPFDQSRLLLK